MNLSLGWQAQEERNSRPSTRTTKGKSLLKQIRQISDFFKSIWTNPPDAFIIWANKISQHKSPRNPKKRVLRRCPLKNRLGTRHGRAWTLRQSSFTETSPNNKPNTCEDSSKSAKNTLNVFRRVTPQWTPTQMKILLLMGILSRVAVFTPRTAYVEIC